jgi:N-acetylglucosaminyldiphosphoundecaprenol N-acetyl-beta-D-mannosaminyltransferase
MAARAETTGAFCCCEVRIDAFTLDAAIDCLRIFTAEGGGRAIHLCNAWTLALAGRDAELAAALNRGDLNLPDGTPLTWIGRRVGFEQMRQPVRGTTFLLAAALAGRDWQLRHYFYGSTPNVVGRLANRISYEAPGIEVVGVESPPFRPLTKAEEAELVSRVHLARPDVMWVGLGTPRQDIFVDQFRERLGVTMVAVGAAFDFLAGAKRQAPTWMQDRGLEWAFRLATEPRRLWKRYLVGNALFLVGAVRGIEVCLPASPLPRDPVELRMNQEARPQAGAKQ